MEHLFEIEPVSLKRRFLEQASPLEQTCEEVFQGPWARSACLMKKEILYGLLFV